MDIDQTRAAYAAAFLSKQFPNKRFELGRITGHHTTDILIIATTSKRPLCHPDDFTARLIISLGADADDQHELDSSWTQHADIFVDTLDSVRYGDLRQWKMNNLISDEQLIDLISLLKNGTPPQNRTRIFISTGTALFDNITIGYLLHADEKCGREAEHKA